VGGKAEKIEGVVVDRSSHRSTSSISPALLSTVAVWSSAKPVRNFFAGLLLILLRESQYINDLGVESSMTHLGNPKFGLETTR
jgi:hypothetical protein